MPIGHITPGVSTTVTPDVLPPAYASIQGPSPTMDVVAQDILDLSLVVMNVQAYAQKAELDSTQDIPLATQAVDRIQHNTWVPWTTSGVPSWYLLDSLATIGGDGPIGPSQFNVSGSPDPIQQTLDLPDGSVFFKVEVRLIGQGHSLLPAVMPGIAMFKKTKADATVALIWGTTGDPSGNVAAYEVVHAITLDVTPGGGITVDNTAFEYIVVVFGESGSHAIPSGLVIVSDTTTCMVSKVDKGAS
jgi:hypothetical protein